MFAIDFYIIIVCLYELVLGFCLCLREMTAVLKKIAQKAFVTFPEIAWR